MNEIKSFYKFQKVQVQMSYNEIHFGVIKQINGGYPNYSKEFVRVSGIGDPVSVDIVSPVENWVNIPGLYDAGYRAYSGTSFSPERRAESIVKDYEEELNSDLKSIPEEEKERYIANYKKYLFAWLSAMSRCYSSMIAGPSNFPVRRMEKLNRYEHNRSEEFSEWIKKALSAIAKKVEDSKPAEQKMDELWQRKKKGLESSLATIIAIDLKSYPGSRPLFVNSVTGAIKTFAKNGETDTVKKALDLIRYWNEKAIEKTGKPCITEKNSVFELEMEAEKNRELSVDKETADNKEYKINGVNIVENVQEDRIQLFFDGKPESAMIQNLKRNAFKWSPSRGCWQRQLTRNAIYATANLLK